MREAFLSIFLFCTAVGHAATFDVTAYGAKGDGQADDAVAIQRAIDACAESGGGQVLFPSGHTFMSSPLQLKSNIDYHFEPNSTLLANPDESIYKLSAFGDNRGEGMRWLWTEDTHDISITGKGCIDGNAERFMEPADGDAFMLKELKDPAFDPRPHVLLLCGVKRLTIRDVTIKGAAYWTIHMEGCEDVNIDGVNILNDLRVRNCDGIDVGHSKHVRIANCRINSGDDCICLKNRREYERYGSCHDITVTGCTMSSRSCAIKIGSENVDSIYNVVIADCVISASNRGLGIQNRDEGTVSQVMFSNIIMQLQQWSDVWWGKAEPIYVTSYARADGNDKDANWRFPKGQTHGYAGAVSDICFNNITARAEGSCFIGCDEDGKVSNVRFRNVDLTIEQPRQASAAGKAQLGLIDRRPAKATDIEQVGLYGVYVERATGIDTSGLTVHTKVADYKGTTNR